MDMMKIGFAAIFLILSILPSCYFFDNGFSFALGYYGEYGEYFIPNAGEAELRKSF